jgi:hypothetical protein
VAPSAAETTAAASLSLRCGATSSDLSTAAEEKSASPCGKTSQATLPLCQLTYRKRTASN